MNPVIKHEMIRLGFSILFMSILFAVMYFALPKITERAGGRQAAGFWTQERKEQARRLFGEGDDAV